MKPARIIALSLAILPFGAPLVHSGPLSRKAVTRSASSPAASTMALGAPSRLLHPRTPDFSQIGPVLSFLGLIDAGSVSTLEGTEALQEQLRAAAELLIDDRDGAVADRDRRLAVLTHPLISKQLTAPQQESIKQVYDRLSAEKRANLEETIAAAAKSWTSAGAELVPASALAYPLALREQPAGHGLSKPVGKVFEMLPHGLRSALAGKSERFRLHEIALLRREIAALMPEDAFKFMASLPQTSHDYLVHSFPEIPKAAKEAERTIANHPEWPDFMVRGERREAQELEWFKRLKQVTDKMSEIQALEKELSSDEAQAQSAIDHLSLGVIYGFAYGFSWKVDPGIKKADMPYIDRATEHYKQALKFFESPNGNPQAALLTRFLLGKHALNGMDYYSNAGRYTLAWESIGPDPEAAEYLSVAKAMLQNVIDALAPTAQRERDPGNKPIEIYYEARRHMVQTQSWERYITGKTSLHEGPYFQTWEAPHIEAILLEVLSFAPPVWVMGQLKDRYGLIHRLINRVRWGRQDARDEEATSALYSLEQSGPELTYEQFIRTLVEKAGYRELEPLLPKYLKP